MLPGLVSSRSLKRTLRSLPHVYSALCRCSLFYSRSIIGARQRHLYWQHRDLFAMSEMEARHCAQLRRDGYALIEGFFDVALADRIYEKADRLFRALKLDMVSVYGEAPTLARMSYDEIAATQKLVCASNPMVEVPEYVDMAFNESILRIVANFFGYVPPTYQGLIVRDFPHSRPKHSSNFHKDYDDADSLQIFIYLVDIDDTRGAQVYVPGSHRHDARSCRPRLSRDLGLEGYDGRLSDEEVARIYPRESWAVLRPKRGSVGFISGNGIHKGPVWGVYGDSRNQPRTALRIDVQSFQARRVGLGQPRKHRRMRQEDYVRLTPLQRLFTGVYYTV